jgi:site-specific DNA recombinase
MVSKLLQREVQKQRPEAKIKEEIAQYVKRLSNMEDDFADRLIDLETFSKSKKRYQTEIEKLREELEQTTSKGPDVQRLLKKGIHVLQQLPQFYQNSSIEVKRDILGSIFPEKLKISENKCRTAKINEALLLISATDKGLSGQKKGQPYKNLELSAKVENTGVEPFTIALQIFST